VLCWRDRRSGFCVGEKPAGGTDKAERRREPGAWVQAQQVPWTTGLKKGELRHISPASNSRPTCNKLLITTERLPISRDIVHTAGVPMAEPSLAAAIAVFSVRLGRRGMLTQA
jgi:hypothetical protein